VTQGIINSLGIMSKRHFHLSRFSNGIPFGQKEKLVTRLKNIISAYPRCIPGISGSAIGTYEQWGSNTQSVPPLGVDGPRVKNDGTSVRW
jgi:hypothetical protein